jgi:integrase
MVSEMLGHSTVEMTLNIYALPTMQAEAAAALEALTVRARHTASYVTEER